MNYQKRLKRLKIFRPNLAQTAYDYQGSELGEIFEKFERFRFSNLKKFKKDHQLPTIAFCYHQDNTVDGMAGDSFGAPYIFLNRGIIEIVYRFFHNHEAAFIYPEFNAFREMREELQMPLGNIMFQLTSLFAFYHERAHILQTKEDVRQSNTVNMNTRNLAERYALGIVDMEYDEEAHAMEFDADMEAARLSARHVIESWGGHLDNHRVRLMLSLAAAGILVYWLYLCNGQYNLYFRRGNHPHPLIRSFYVVDAMLKQARQHAGIDLNSEEVLNSALRISDAIYEHEPIHPIQAFFNALENNGDEIEAYVNDLIAISDDYPNLVRNQFGRGKKFDWHSQRKSDISGLEIGFVLDFRNSNEKQRNYDLSFRS